MSALLKRKDPTQLAAQLAELKGGSSYNEADGKEWKLTLDTAGNGTAVIRFLPGKTPDSMPFVKLINHGFKIGSKWYIENCTSTHGKFDECPVCKHISENDLYNTDNAMYGKLKRKSSFWANILVVKDPAHPENDGKVFKYRFGQKIMDKINSMVEVDTDIGEVPVDVTCPFDGANFTMKVKKVSGFSNYDDCKFQKQTAIPNIDDEAVQAKLIEDMFDIDSIISKDKFNSFEKNLESFNRVMGTAALGGAAAEASKNAEAIANELNDFDNQMAQFSASATNVEPEPQPVQAQKSEDPELNDLLNGL